MNALCKAPCRPLRISPHSSDIKCPLLLSPLPLSSTGPLLAHLWVHSLSFSLCAVSSMKAWTSAAFQCCGLHGEENVDQCWWPRSYIQTRTALSPSHSPPLGASAPHFPKQPEEPVWQECPQAVGEAVPPRLSNPGHRETSLAALPTSTWV